MSKILEEKEISLRVSVFDHYPALKGFIGEFSCDDKHLLIFSDGLRILFRPEGVKRSYLIEGVDLLNAVTEIIQKDTKKRQVIMPKNQK